MSTSSPSSSQSSPQGGATPGDPSGAGAGFSKGLQLSLGAIVVAVLLGWYGYTNLGEGVAFTYYQSLDEMAAAGLTPGTKGLRVHGYVASQSIQRDLEGRQVRFLVQNDPPHAVSHSEETAGGERLTVVYNSLETPDLFKDGAEVVVEGRLQGADGGVVFVADNVMAKCPSKFQAEVDGGGAPPGAQAL